VCGAATAQKPAGTSACNLFILLGRDSRIDLAHKHKICLDTIEISLLGVVLWPNSPERKGRMFRTNALERGIVFLPLSQGIRAQDVYVVAFS